MSPAPPKGSGFVNGMAKAFSALKMRSYRMLWFGILFSLMAMQIDLVARSWLAYNISGSALVLGLVAAARGIPQLILSPLGGVAADRFDKRRLLVTAETIVFALALATAVLVHTGLIQIWHLIALGLLQGIVTPFSMPVRTALVPHLVEERQIPNALALESTARNINRVFAPAVAGVLIAVNPTLAFYATAGVYGLGVLTLMRLPRGLKGEGVRSGPFAEMMVGFRYILDRPPLIALLLLAYIPILLGMPFQQLLPVFQTDVFDVSPRALGFMYTAVGVGAIFGSMVVAYLADTPHKNKLQIMSGIAFGITLAAFALSTNYVLALGLLAVAGFMSSGYLTFNRMLVVLQTERPLYGRVMSVYGMTWSLMPLALLPIGALVDRFGAPASVAGSGLALSVTITLIALKFSHYYLKGSTRAPVQGD
jgi:MFS family permease